MKAHKRLMQSLRDVSSVTIPIDTYYVFGSGNAYISGVPKALADLPRVDMGHNGFWGCQGVKVPVETLAGLNITGYAYPGGSRPIVKDGKPTHNKFIINW